MPITQIMTFYDDYKPKSYKEVVNCIVIVYKEYNKRGQVILERVLIDDSYYHELEYDWGDYKKYGSPYKTIKRIIPLECLPNNI